jgi:hypothetical protein
MANIKQLKTEESAPYEDKLKCSGALGQGEKA